MEEKIDLNANAVISQIYNIVRHWYDLEKANVNSGTEYEKRWMNTITNFDFSGFSTDEEFESSTLILEELFTASEQCFIPNRMRLIASQIVERFGQPFINILNTRLEWSLINIWKTDKKRAKELIAQFPCLWIVHIMQSFSILSSL
jgi:hypothetical protein